MPLTASSSPTRTFLWMIIWWAKTAYLNMIHRAKKYVYITTPYLIIDNEMMTSLCTAAKAGIDARIASRPISPIRKPCFS